MAIETVPLPLPPTADPSKFNNFGREVRGVHPGRLTDEEFKEIEQLLYKVCVSPLMSRVLPCSSASCSTTHCYSRTLISYLRNSTISRRCVRCERQTPVRNVIVTLSPSRLSTLRATPTVTATTKPRKTPSQSFTVTSRRFLGFLRFSSSGTAPFTTTRVSPKSS